MKNKRTANIFVFTIAVIALLLRPFVFYQITEIQNLGKDPIAVNNLLQRLIKKKDDHHSPNFDECMATQCVKRKSPSSLLFTFLQKKFNQYPGELPAAYNSWQPSTIFKVCPPHKYYRLLSKFQI